MEKNYLINGIMKSLENKLNEEYTKTKEKMLNDMDATLELKRNDIIKELLNTISIRCSQENQLIAPEINIKISRW